MLLRGERILLLNSINLSVSLTSRLYNTKRGESALSSKVIKIECLLTADCATYFAYCVLTAFSVLTALMMALSTVRTVLTGVDCVRVHDAIVFVFVVMLTVCC